MKKNIKEIVERLSEDEQKQFHQYVTSIKEIKNKLAELIAKGEKSMQEGGNVSSNLVLDLNK